MSISTETIRAAGAPLAVVPAEDGWEWVLKATGVAALAVGVLQLVEMAGGLWATGLGGLVSFGGRARIVGDLTDLLWVGFGAVTVANVVCLIVAGLAALKRMRRARGWMLAAAVLRAIVITVGTVVGLWQMWGSIASSGGPFMWYYLLQRVISTLIAMWLPVLLAAVATRPAIKLLLDEPRPGGAFEPLPAPAAQPESPTPP